MEAVCEVFKKKKSVILFSRLLFVFSIIFSNLSVW